MGPQERSLANQLVRLVVVAALVAFLVWLIVIPLLTTDGGGYVLAGIVVLFGLLLLGIDLSQRRRHRHLVRLREHASVAYVIRETFSWETGFITADAETLRLWRLEKAMVVPVSEFDRSKVQLEPAMLPVSNFHQRPGLTLVVGGETMAAFWLVKDRHGLIRRRLTGDDHDRAVRSLREGRLPVK